MSRELAVRLRRTHIGAALLTGCADDGDEFLGIRHGFSSVSVCSAENKIGFRSPSLKPILLDENHRLLRYIMLDAVTLGGLAYMGPAPFPARLLRQHAAIHN